MARKYTSGAEFQSTAADVEVDSTSGTTISIDTTLKRTGAASWKFVCAASGPFVTRQYTAANGDTFVRAYINVTSMTTAVDIAIILIRDGTSGNNANIRLNRDSASTFHLELWNEQASVQLGSDSGTLNTGTWYRVEFSYTRSTGAMAARIDGTQFATGTGTANLNSNTLRWGSIDSSTMTINYDDIAVNDATGSFQTSYPGAGGVFRMNPNNSGDVNTFATQTGGTAGAANNYTRLLETVPDDATTFNGSSTLNQEDLVNYDPSGLSSSDTINVVEVWARYRNSTADPTGAITFEVEKTGSGTKTSSSAIVPNSTTWRTNANAVPKTPPIVTYQNPDAANWVNTTLDTLQAGYKLTTAPGTAGRRVDVSQLIVIVDYTPATTTQQTITGKARIEKSVSQTQLGRARIEKSASQTTTGKARIEKSGTQTVQGKSRIEVSTPRTVTGKAAIQRTTTRDVTGVARVTRTVSQTVAGIARITATTLRTITGKARITVSTSQTVAGKGRIQKAVAQVVQGLARITASTNRTVTGKAAIQKTTTRTILGQSRITRVISQTVTGMARVTASTARTITGVASIVAASITTTKTVTGRARIQITTLRTIAGLARIERAAQATITGKSRIEVSSLQTIAGRARVTALTARNQLGLARLEKGRTETVQGRSRITITVLQIQQGRARVTITTIQTVSGKADITQQSQQTITGVARIIGLVPGGTISLGGDSLPAYLTGDRNDASIGGDSMADIPAPEDNAVALSGENASVILS